MLDQFAETSLYMIPVVAFIMGLSGSLHCVAMCGAIATTCSSKLSQNISYQFGRVVSYTMLGLCAGFLGERFKLLNENPYFKSLPAFLLGLFFIYWGYSTYTGKKTSIPLPKFLSQTLTKILGKFYQQKNSALRSFSIGTFTSLLPCGLLYGVVISLAIFQNPMIGALGMFFFTLGTIPALLVSPTIIRKLLSPLQLRFPKVTSLSLITFGLLTISYRLYTSYGAVVASCH